MKKILCAVLVLAMMMSLSVTAFAAEPVNTTNNDVKATKYSVELDSNGIVSVSDENGNIMPRSSISGYQNGDVTSNSSGFIVWVDSSGIGGMGVTVKTSCPEWNGTVTFYLVSDRGSVAVNGDNITTNGETYYENLIHGLPGTPAYYLANFNGIPDGYTIHVDIWIYG